MNNGRRGGIHQKLEEDSRPNPVTKTLSYKIQSTFLKTLNLKEKAKTHAHIDFFHPPKKTNQPSKHQGNMLTKVSSKITGKESLKVKADELRYDELGMTNYYGSIPKRIRETNKYHTRWLVIRGFDLYFYRTTGDEAQKDILPLPAK